MAALYTIPGHSSLVAACLFQKGPQPDYILSGGVCIYGPSTLWPSYGPATCRWSVCACSRRARSPTTSSQVAYIVMAYIAMARLWPGHLSLVAVCVPVPEGPVQTSVSKTTVQTRVYRHVHRTCTDACVRTGQCVAPPWETSPQ